MEQEFVRKKKEILIQQERKKVWLNAWYSMATNNDIESIEVCTKAADECLKAFDERFGQ